MKFFYLALALAAFVAGCGKKGPLEHAPVSVGEKGVDAAP